jgi:hypothetical protein
MGDTQERPIFFDARQKRWPRFRRGLFAAAFAFTVLFAGFVATVLVNPVLPVLKLPQSSLLPRGGHLAPPAPPTPPPVASRRFADAKRRLQTQHERGPRSCARASRHRARR